MKLQAVRNSCLAASLLALGCVIATDDGDTDAAGSTSADGADTGGGNPSGDPEDPDDDDDDDDDNSADDDAEDTLGELECELCEADALVDGCSDAVAACEADVGCDLLFGCIDACSEDEDEACLVACLDATDDASVALLDDVFVCVADACPLCEPLDLEPIDAEACEACEDEAVAGACADENAACEESVDCLDLVLCIELCDEDDDACLGTCIEEASPAAIELIDQLGVCVGEQCPVC